MSLCTITIQVEIEAKTLESYEKKRDRIIGKLEKQGFSVNVEDDGEDDFEEE